MSGPRIPTPGMGGMSCMSCVVMVSGRLDCGGCLYGSGICVAAAETGHEGWFCGAGFDNVVVVVVMHFEVGWGLVGC